MSKKKKLLSQPLKYPKSHRQFRSKLLLNNPKMKKSHQQVLNSCVSGIRMHSPIKMKSRFRNPLKSSKSPSFSSLQSQNQNLKSSSLFLCLKDSIFVIRQKKRMMDTCPQLIRVWKPRKNNLKRNSLRKNNPKRNMLLAFLSRKKNHSRLSPLNLKRLKKK